MVVGDNTIVNDFMFCRDHGYEVCHYCYCDHRMCNNIRIEHELRGIFEAVGYDPEERDPFRVFFLGAVKGPKKNTYQCREHKKVNCGKCFDWVRLIKMGVGLPVDENLNPFETLD